MRIGWGDAAGECQFDVPPRFGVADRRMAGMAIAAWQAGGRVRVAGFEHNSMTVTQVDGVPIMTACADTIAAAFGMAPGMALTKRIGLVAELVAACDLIMLRSEPVPFEASLAAPGRALLLARGVALPLLDTCDNACENGEIQIIISWREVLDRAATTRLRREIGIALGHLRPVSVMADPFCQISTPNSNG